MEYRQPSRFALLLLRRLARANEPLAGDLLEAFRSGRSRRWLWVQILASLAIRSPGPAFVPPPLGIAPADWMPMPRRPIRDFAAAMSVNMTASPVHGVGGLGLLALAVIMTAAQPAAWLFLLCALGGGVLLGLLRVARGRRRPAHGALLTTVRLDGIS